MADDEEFRFAQLSDVHLGPLPPFWPRHWNAKRIVGFINFWTKRRSFNNPKMVHALVGDLKAQRFDHVAVTGDLANLGMPAEFEQCDRWLEALGTPDNVSAIPGNHDIYCKLLSDPGVERWRPYMSARRSTDVVAGVPDPLASGFPYVRTFGSFALIGLNSAIPTPPAESFGSVGAEQIDRFKEVSSALHAAGYTRIVMIHHPPLIEHGSRGLNDRVAFERALSDHGAELVIHGHFHRGMISWRRTATGPMAVVGAGAVGEGVYNLYHLRRTANGRLAIELAVRVGSGMGKTFEQRQAVELEPPPEVVTEIV